MSKTDFKADVDARTNQEQLEHEIVDCLDEECAVRCTRRHVLLVRAEVLHANI